MAGFSPRIKRGLVSIAVGALTVTSSVPTGAVPLGLSRGAKVLFHPEGELAKVPKGWKQLCQDHPQDCKVDNSHEPITPEFTEARLEELQRINLSVNRQIKPRTDMRNYGVSEKWAYAENGYGDCEDYALVKRRKLIALGWPRESLLITVVWSGNEGHSVLTVHTDQGDYVLDNQSSKVTLWTKTRYDYVKRQSRYNQNLWVYIDGTPQPTVLLASAKPAPAPTLTKEKVAKEAPGAEHAELGHARAAVQPVAIAAAQAASKTLDAAVADAKMQAQRNGILEVSPDAIAKFYGLDGSTAAWDGGFMAATSDAIVESGERALQTGDARAVVEAEPKKSDAEPIGYAPDAEQYYWFF